MLAPGREPWLDAGWGKVISESSSTKINSKTWQMSCSPGVQLLIVQEAAKGRQQTVSGHKQMGAGIHPWDHLKTGLKPKENCAGNQELFSVLCWYHVYLQLSAHSTFINGKTGVNTFKQLCQTAGNNIKSRAVKHEYLSLPSHEDFSRARGIPRIPWEKAAPQLPISHVAPLVWAHGVPCLNLLL